MWSRSIGNGPFKTTRRAVHASERDRGASKPTTAVPSPSLTLFGASTPQAFYAALTAANVEDGFMSRFLIAPAAPRAAKISGERQPVPPIIVHALRAVPPVGEGRLSAVLDVFSPLGRVDESALEWSTADVEARADAFEEEILAVIDAKPAGYPLLGRVFEYAVRLASLHAVSRGGVFAKVTRADLEWGAAWAIDSARSMMDSAATMMARNEHEERVNAVSTAVRSKGTIAQSELLRTCRHINSRELGMIIDQLVGARVIERGEVPGRGRPKAIYAWLG